MKQKNKEDENFSGYSIVGFVRDVFDYAERISPDDEDYEMIVERLISDSEMCRKTLKQYPWMIYTTFREDVFPRKLMG